MHVKLEQEVFKEEIFEDASLDFNGQFIHQSLIIFGYHCKIFIV